MITDFSNLGRNLYRKCTKNAGSNPVRKSNIGTLWVGSDILNPRSRVWQRSRVQFLTPPPSINIKRKVFVYNLII